MPYGLIWLVLTVLVLVLVIVYDRRSIDQAKGHIETGHELETTGLYIEALNEYEQAFENKRLGRKAKGDVALAMANIYYEYLEDYPTANRYYVQARQISPSTMNAEDVQERARNAAVRAKGSGVFKAKPTSNNGVTTKTIIQRVDLLQAPQADLQGPVVATYNGGEIRAGHLLRALEKRPEFLRPDFRESPEKLESFLNGIVRETMAYEAAVKTGVHKDPDVTSRLYDYQKSLVTQRYLVDRREEAMVVDNADVEKYYREHLNDYVKPGQINVSVIKSDSETSAAEILQMLRTGQRFEEVATSFSIEQTSAARGGDIGTITEKDTSVSGVGEVPRVVEALFKLPVYSVSEVTPVGDSYYIFRISSVVPALNITLDEARGKIENILRGRAVDQARSGLDEDMKKVFDPQVNEEGLERFWDFARQTHSLNDDSTTASSTATESSSDADTTTVSVTDFSSSGSATVH